jgi:N-methylhydantoinase A
MQYAIAIDIGGTCTDCIALDSAGEITTAKTFSTPPDFSVGIFDGLQLLASSVGTELDQLLASTSLFLHSTTVAENAIVNGTMSTAGLITTRGFEDTLYATRGGYGRWSGLTEVEKKDAIRTNKPRTLVPRTLIRGIEERALSNANRLVDIDDAEVERAVKDLLEAEVGSVAVCLLWSFLASDAEDRVVGVVKRLRPNIFVVASHEVAPVLGEYERTSSTVLNARLGPVVVSYLAQLQQRLRQRRFGGAILVMQSYGGLVSIPEAAARPTGLIESGPVAGVLGAKDLGASLGLGSIIAADMGGTTFKVGVVHKGHIDYERESMALRYHLSGSKLDITSLGLAGGSIISVDDATGLPAIGPSSAGSFPGPACYGNGGAEPTVTDVDAILGYFNRSFFLGGKKEINIGLALKSFREKVAMPLGLSTEDAASRIYRLANSIIYDMLHKATVQRGLDPRRFTLVSIGGTAGMHVAAYASLLGVEQIIIPATASVHCAAGLLNSDVVHEEQIAKPSRLPVIPRDVESIFASLSRRVLARLRQEGFEAEAVSTARSIDMRYARQTNIVTVPVEDSPRFDALLLDKTVDRFEDLYRKRYGDESGYREAGIELVNFRFRGIGHVNRPRQSQSPTVGGEPDSALVDRRVAWVDDLGEFLDVNGYSFDRLRPGDVVRGPAIIWSAMTTVVLRSVDAARVDGRANLILVPYPEATNRRLDL